MCLFVDRALATDAAFSADVTDLETVSKVCRQLDGLPLAIELAAARVRGLSLHDLAQHLDERFHILTAGPRTNRRHRSLAAVLDWSYAQLSPIEQQVFDRLAVFTGSFGLDAACSVVAGDAVTSDAVTAAVLRLVDCALLAELRGAARAAMCSSTRCVGTRSTGCVWMTGWWLPRPTRSVGGCVRRARGNRAERLGRIGLGEPAH